ncbi:MAG: MFS transporter [Candidatus Hydrogenedentes bacterium]|nr:MFS transporter [Candidatus Hydrogenedentota bacterium]
MSAQEQQQEEALSPEARSVLKIVFVTLFLDLVGFSIIFPLFPAMLDYYVAREGGAGLVGWLVSALEGFTRATGGPEEIGLIILFGGVLASLYSMLQFVFSPIIGSLSDRWGRRPLLLVCIAGLVLSYVMWFFAGPFLVLVLARILGGIAAGNISTATAVVADVTSTRNRPKGMAIIGMAFGIGFVVGPAIGGFSAAIDLTERWPGLADYGVNPFSVPALIALGLALLNFVYVAIYFKETLPQAMQEASRTQRSMNPIALFRGEAYPGVRKTNLTNFFFLTAFAGSEFGLTFLAMDRLGYGPRENAYLFVFIGLTLALVQGTYVRLRAPIIGAKKMTLHGFVTVIPGIGLLALANSTWQLYVALFFMAVGSAQIIPCLTSLASTYAPPDDQGRVLGVFRSLGALARGIGPLIACLLYWGVGSAPAYLLMAAAVALPLGIAASLPKAPDPAL